MSTRGDVSTAQLTVTERVVGRGLDELLSRDIPNKRHDSTNQAEETSPSAVRGHGVLDRHSTRIPPLQEGLGRTHTQG